MLKTYTYDKLSPSELKSVLARPRIDSASIMSTVSGKCVALGLTNQRARAPHPDQLTAHGLCGYVNQRS